MWTWERSPLLGIRDEGQKMRCILSLGGVAVLAGVCAALVGAGQQAHAATRGQAAVGQLQSPDEETRKAAKAEVLDIYKELGGSLKQGEQVSDLPEYQEIVNGLIPIVAKQRERYLPSFDEKLLAVQLLGEMRAAEAVEVLLDNIWFCPSPGVDEKVIEAGFPCVGALIKIGKPSVAGIMARLDRQYQYRDMGILVMYHVVVRKVQGREASRALLQAELEKARTRQANVVEMLYYSGQTVADLGTMLRDEDPQVRFAAARLYARFMIWPGPAAASTAEERAKFVADTLARMEREGGARAGSAAAGAQPQPKPAQPPAPAQ
jgi:hypothetical protein